MIEEGDIVRITKQKGNLCLESECRHFGTPNEEGMFREFDTHRSYQKHEGNGG